MSRPMPPASESVAPSPGATAWRGFILAGALAALGLLLLLYSLILWLDPDQRLPIEPNRATLPPHQLIRVRTMPPYLPGRPADPTHVALKAVEATGRPRDQRLAIKTSGQLLAPAFEAANEIATRKAGML